MLNKKKRYTWNNLLFQKKGTGDFFGSLLHYNPN